MSHFTVLVTNTNITSYDDQLERFYEQGDPDDYFMVKSIEIQAAEVKNAVLEIMFENRNDESLLEKYQGWRDNGEEDKVIANWFGYDRDDEGNFYTISNPEAKWDWYKEGGRWSNYFWLKDGTRADSAMVKDIDWDTMKAESRADAESYWAKYQAEPDKGSAYFMYGIEEDDTVDTYAERMSDAKTHAILHDNEWTEAGSMGWFGFVSDKQDSTSWDKKFWEIIESLDPESEVAVIDCHI